MSEMGQTRPFGDVRSMSALMRFADLTQSACDVPQVPLSDICSAASGTLLDHFVGAQKQRGRDIEADCRGSFHVEHKFKDRWLLDWKIGWRSATQNLDEQPGHLSVHQSKARAETDEAAIFHDFR
jgi:hypothetical protein